MEEDKQYKIDKRMLKIAKFCSEGSYAIRRQVGAIIVKNNRIISDGYNGTPSGFPNICENYITKLDNGKNCYQNIIEPKTFEELLEANKNGCELITKNCVLHAEANAITKLAKCAESANGATLYITDEPCIECSKLIIQFGIKRVVYWRDYRLHDGINLLKQADIEVKQIENII